MTGLALSHKQIEVVAAVLIEQGRVLAAQRAAGDEQGGLWELPGGKIEPGETPEGCLARELREELDVQVQVLELVATVEHDYPSFRIRLQAYRCLLLAGRPTRREHQDLRWLAADELNSVSWSAADRPIVARLAPLLGAAPRPLAGVAGPRAMCQDARVMSSEQAETVLHTDDDLQAIQRVAQARLEILAEIEKRIVGQRQVIDQLLVALFSRGHCLFVGVPGLAKTLLISTLAELLNLAFARIQFTPDLMPSDITGTDILQDDPVSGRRFFRFIKGPIFANLVLADEINRTPPKTQAALLQAMQEYRVTAGGTTYELPPPFLVFATQNPIEHEGTYPLPEAQLDRFMFQVEVGYPSEDEEVAIVKQTTGDYEPVLHKVLGPEQIHHLQGLIRRVPAADHVVRFAVKLCRASRPGSDIAPPVVRQYLSWGAGPRASQYLILAAKAKAILEGNFAVRSEDIQSLARPTLQHRLVRNFHAEAEGVTSSQIVDRLIEVVKP